MPQHETVFIKAITLQLHRAAQRPDALHPGEVHWCRPPIAHIGDYEQEEMSILPEDQSRNS
jgi:hypothetical protein